MKKWNPSPFKWAGGKGKVLDTLIPIIERYDFETFVEPFVGAANVSLNVDAKSYVWNDMNQDLVNSYQTMLHRLEDYLHYCNVMFEYGFEYYNEYRDRFNSRTLPNVQEAACFQYLNKHGFNGLCRYNQKGIFNVPRGTVTKKTKTVPEDAIRTLNKRHKSNTLLRSLDFRAIIDLTEDKEDTLIYCDPPYVPLTSEFKYTKDGFNQADQEDLKDMCKNSSHVCIISNHWTEYTKDLYSDADEVIVFEVQRTISCKGNERKKVQEVIAIYE